MNDDPHDTDRDRDSSADTLAVLVIIAALTAFSLHIASGFTFDF